jgi:hypothetical protein
MFVPLVVPIAGLRAPTALRPRLLALLLGTTLWLLPWLRMLSLALLRLSLLRMLSLALLRLSLLRMRLLLAMLLLPLRLVLLLWQWARLGRLRLRGLHLLVLRLRLRLRLRRLPLRRRSLPGPALVAAPTVVVIGARYPEAKGNDEGCAKTC